jgi:hypothetical protein
MRGLPLMTAAMVLFGCSSTLAQQLGSIPMRPATSTRLPDILATLPGMRTNSPGMPATSAMTVPLTPRAAGASPGTALGAIGTTLGTPATVAATIGTITACATIGSAAGTGTPFNATFGDPVTGALPPQPLPGATIPPPYSFGPSITTDACNPTVSTTATIEALGSSVAVTLPGLASTTATTYSDATVPSTATEAVGAAGLSPLIVVPTPVIPTASPCAGSMMITSPSGLAMTGSTGVAATSGLSSASAC